MRRDRQGVLVAFLILTTAASLRDAIEDSRVTYTLGFYPNSGGIDGKFHNVLSGTARGG